VQPDRRLRRRRYCAPRTRRWSAARIAPILLHDCVPLNPRMAFRQWLPGDSSEKDTARFRVRYGRRSTAVVSGELELADSRPLYEEPDRLTELFSLY